MRVAVYARVSTQRQAQIQSIEPQIERLQAHVQRQGWTLAPQDIYRDDGYSGATLRRPGLERLRDRAAGAHLDRILVSAPDRLARNYVHQVLLVEELQRHGAEVEFLDRPMSQDPHDRLLLQIRGAVAEYERRLIADRMRRGRLRKLQSGTLLPWTQPPYGYRLDPDRPRDPAGVRVDESEAAVVRNLFVWFVEEGLTLVGLVGRLRELGIPSPQGHEYWPRTTLRGLLTNPTYTGQVLANRTCSQAAHKRRSPLQPVGHRASSTRTDPEQWIPVAQVPALVSEEQFALAQAQLRRNRERARRNAKEGRYLLRALVSCGHCRRSCIGRRASPRYTYYLCRIQAQAQMLVGGEQCRARHIPAPQLDALVWQDLCTVLQHPEAIAQAMARAKSGCWQPQELQARRTNLRRGRGALRQQMERLTEAYLAAALGLEEYRRRRSDLELRLCSLERQEELLSAEAEQRDELAQLAAYAEDFCRRIGEGLEQAGFTRKRELIELLIDRVVVTEDLVEIRYVIPTHPSGEQQRFCLLRTDYQAVDSSGRFSARKPPQCAGCGASGATPRAPD